MFPSGHLLFLLSSELHPTYVVITNLHKMLEHIIQRLSRQFEKLFLHSFFFFFADEISTPKPWMNVSSSTLSDGFTDGRYFVVW